jgi:protein-tyrosine phosphatase
MIHQLKERGIIPIIAHAERNPMIMSQHGLAADLIFQGGRLQVTAASITGDFGRGPLKMARTLAQNNQIFCLGSDIHPGRKYRMKAAQKKLSKWAGTSNILRIFGDNSDSILNDCYESVKIS